MTEHSNINEGDRKWKMPQSDKMVFILTLIISMAFWILIKLSDDYSESYIISVQYENIPVNKQLTKLIDSTFTLTLNTSGYNLLENKIKKRLERITIDLNQCKPEQISGSIYQVKKNDLENYLSKRLGILENNIQVSKNALKFVLEKSNSKKVPVVAVTNLTFSPQFGLYALSVAPSQVTVYGPSSILDTLQNIHTNEVKRKDIDADMVIESALFNPVPSLLRISPDRVKITVDAEKYTESVIEVPVNLSGIPFNIRTFPSKVKVYYHIALKDYNLINGNSFVVKPELKGVDLHKVDRIKLKVSRKPEFVTGVRTDPPEVEFLIIK